MYAIPVGAVLLSGVLVAHRMKLLPVFLGYRLNNPCINSYLLKQGRWWQLLVPALHTYDNMHLAYTVVSLLGVGFYLEPRLGTLRWALTSVGSIVATNLAYCLATRFVLPYYAKEIAGVHHFEMEYKCFLGMTGALMALKVIYSYYYPYGGYPFLFVVVPLPKLIGLALEIALLHFILPHVWIVGNVAGLAVGIVYVLFAVAPH